MFGSRLGTGRAFYRGLLEALTHVMGSSTGYLLTHGPRVAHLCDQLAPRAGLDDRGTAQLVFAAVLSDLGMIGLAEDAWENPVPALDEGTRRRIRLHPERSERTLRAIPHLEGLAVLVRHHHEWWNGRGYPDRLSGSAIPLSARILRLADTVCALGEERPHRPRLEPDQILDVVRKSAGEEFCPDVAALYLDQAEAGQLASFHPTAYQVSLREATGALLPEEVSPPSAGQLLDILASLIDAKDPYTAGHSRRVAILAVAVARQLGLDRRLRDTVWAAGYLHDLGKLGVPLRVLAKQGPLAPEERRQIESHASRGAAILERIEGLRHLTAGTRYHHERWDGSGYPEGLRGDHIPLVAQILAVCDAYDAMTSRRAYRTSRSHVEAMEEIALSTGRHFGPTVAASFLALPESFFQAVREPGRVRRDAVPAAWPERAERRPRPVARG